MKNKGDSGLFTLLIQTNSPGELSNWVTPICKRLAQDYPDARIEIFLTPCAYASGNEAKVAAALPNVVQVNTPKETLSRLFMPVFGLPYRNGAVLFLGGDPFYRKWLGWKFHLPVYSYSERSLGRGFQQSFLRDRHGDLMYAKSLDALPSREQILTKYGLDDQPYCLFFASSRPAQFRHLVPLYQETVQCIQKQLPSFKALLLVSPFIDDDLLSDVESSSDLSAFTIIRGDSRELMSISKMLVSIPGTATAEAMYLGLPMITFLPLNYPKLLIFEGLMGLITRLPLVGILTRFLVIQYVQKQDRRYSIPNILAKKQIVPEYIGRFSPEEMARLILKSYTDEQALGTMRQRLLAQRPKQDVAGTILKAIQPRS